MKTIVVLACSASKLEHPAPAAELRAFAAELGPARWICFAGERYRRALELAGLAFEAPLRGMGIGEQLGALTRELRALEAGE